MSRLSCSLHQTPFDLNGRRQEAHLELFVSWYLKLYVQWCPINVFWINTEWNNSGTYKMGQDQLVLLPNMVSGSWVISPQFTSIRLQLWGHSQVSLLSCQGSGCWKHKQLCSPFSWLRACSEVDSSLKKVRPRNAGSWSSHGKPPPMGLGTSE